MADGDFLDKAELSDEERMKLRSFGASTPAALLGIRMASPGPFDQLFGAERAREIVRQIGALLSDEERSLLQQPISQLPPLGARITPSPQTVQNPPYEIQERDRLFAELQQLRSVHPPTDEVRHRIAELEETLNAMLSRVRPP